MPVSSFTFTIEKPESDDPNSEVCRILQGVIDQIKTGVTPLQYISLEIGLASELADAEDAEEWDLLKNSRVFHA